MRKLTMMTRWKYAQGTGCFSSFTISLQLFRSFMAGMRNSFHRSSCAVANAPSSSSASCITSAFTSHSAQ